MDKTNINVLVQSIECSLHLIRMCNLTFEFILHLYSFFVLFYPQLKVCVADRNIGNDRANIIHRFDDQNSVTSKCIENWALFERLTHSQRLALSVSPGAPGGVPNPKPRKPALFGPVQGCVYKHLSAP